MTERSAPITAGTLLPPRRVRPTTIQLFRFSAASWNAHRIHYDREYARSEGYPDVLVQSHLHGCFLARAALEWAGQRATLRRFRWENRAVAVPGDELTVTGSVTDVEAEAGRTIAGVDLEERNQDGALCALAHAVLAIPAARSGG